MRRGLVPMIVGLATLSIAGSGCAMNSPNKQLVDCHVVGSGLLPADAGGADGLCKAIRDAAADQAPGKRFAVEVRVLGRSMIAATITKADGTKLPEQKMAVSDSELNRSSLERFASALAGLVASSDQ